MSYILKKEIENCIDNKHKNWHDEYHKYMCIYIYKGRLKVHDSGSHHDGETEVQE